MTLHHITHLLTHTYTHSFFTWKAGAGIASVTGLCTCAPISTGRRLAGLERPFTVCASVLRWAAAAVWADLIDTHSIVLAGWGNYGTFVYIQAACGPMKAWRTSADEVGVKCRASATIGTRVWCTWVCLLACLSCTNTHKSLLKKTSIIIQCIASKKDANALYYYFKLTHG